MSDDAERTAASKAGRARRGTATTQNAAPEPEVIDRGKPAGDALSDIARSIGEQAARQAIDEFSRRGYIGRLQTAGAGAGQLGAAAALGACAAGAFTAGVVLLWARLLPKPLAAFATAATLVGAAVPLAMSGSSQIRQGVTGDQL